MQELDRDIARHVLETTDDQYIDRIQFGSGPEEPWLAVTFIEETGVLYYTDTVSHTEAWQGPPENIIEKGQEIIQETIDEYRRLGGDLPETTYHESHDPIFDISEEDLQLP
jgi:hypothetical protein